MVRGGSQQQQQPQQNRQHQRQSQKAQPRRDSTPSTKVLPGLRTGIRRDAAGRRHNQGPDHLGLAGGGTGDANSDMSFVCGPKEFFDEIVGDCAMCDDICNDHQQTLELCAYKCPKFYHETYTPSVSLIQAAPAAVAVVLPFTISSAGWPLMTSIYVQTSSVPDTVQQVATSTSFPIWAISAIVAIVVLVVAIGAIIIIAVLRCRPSKQTRNHTLAGRFDSEAQNEPKSSSRFATATPLLQSQTRDRDFQPPAYSETDPAGQQVPLFHIGLSINNGGDARKSERIESARRDDEDEDSCSLCTEHVAGNNPTTTKSTRVVHDVVTTQW